MKIYLAMAVATAASLVAACGVIDLNTLIGIVDAGGLPSQIKSCAKPSGGKMLVASARHAATYSAIGNAWQRLPQDLQDDAVVRAILAHAQSVPLKTPVIHSDNSISFIDETTIAAPKVSAPVVTPAHGDFFKFAKLVAEYAIRRQTHSPGSDPSKPSPFVQLFGQYYQNYYQGKFVTYFGESYDQPVVSFTTNDNEITQPVGLFFEFLFDYALQSPVWYDGKNYYPGNNSNLPSLLAINNRKPVTVPTLPPSSDPCGMTGDEGKNNQLCGDPIRYCRII